MTASRTTTRSTAKGGRAVLHARKNSTDSVSGQPALITDMSLSRTARDSDERQSMIRDLAYHYAESRGFTPGHELDDWLAAEAAVDARLISEGRAY